MPFIFAGIIILLFVAVVLIRAAGFKPQQQTATATAAVKVDRERAVKNLAAMVQIKTVSSKNAALVDEAEFARFRALLKTLYPAVHAHCTLETAGPSGLIYRYNGRDEAAAPTVLMSHYDVVPATDDGWKQPPFSGAVVDGILWGRGTLDTKGTLCGVMEACEDAVNAGFVPKADIYLCFAGDEEIGGESAPAIVEKLAAKGLRPALVVDEGGAVVEGVFPGVSAKTALVGTGEKGMANIEFVAKGMGGHASSPPVHSAVGVMAKAVTSIEAHPFKQHISKPAREMLDTLGRHSTLLMRALFANMWCFEWLIKKSAKPGSEMAAMFKTTVAVTMAEGSLAPNVLPATAKATANLRLNGTDTPQSAAAYLKSVVNDPNVEVRLLDGNAPTPYADTTSEGWYKVKQVIGQTWPGAIVSPYLMIACSDSRHYCAISDTVLRFSAIELTNAERASIHNINECVPLEKVEKYVEFYKRLVELC